MFGFMRTSKKLSKAETVELKMLEDLKKSLGDEAPLTTNLKNRLRIIDLEDKVVSLERQIKKILNKEVIVKRPYKKRKKLNV